MESTSRSKSLEKLCHISKKSTINLEFQDLKYSVKDSSIKGGRRQILNFINGRFSSGELTAILGPSGAGKTSLLNVLAGYVSSGVQGDIYVNNHPRVAKLFNEMCAYIMQDNIVQPHLTVEESINYASGLKLGASLKPEEKCHLVREVINFLGLQDCASNLNENLSGGERKRLTIATELVSNPPVIFLDEPTTGLDDFAAKQCVDFLKKISSTGRTVICTIHQPSTSLLNSFDQLYILADGFCVYNGTPAEMVSFFTLSGYSCPSNYTPADYMMELVYLDPTALKSFKETIQNGKINMKAEVLETVNQEQILFTKKHFSSTFQNQFCLLLSRIFLQMSRNRTIFYLLFFHHLIGGFAMAALFGGIGNSASHAFSILWYCVGCNMYFIFTYTMLPALLFPFEVDLVKKEFFNKWYSLEAYYSALTVANLPLIFIFGAIFTAIVYFLTDQPMEIDRFVGFYVTNVMVGLTSQGLGYLIGSVVPATKGAVIGPSVIATFFVFAVHGMGYREEISSFHNFLMRINFLRSGVESLCNTLFYNRELLDCNEVFCYYARPELLMRDNSIVLAHYTYNLMYLFIFLVIFRIVGYCVLKCKLNWNLYFSHEIK